MKSSNNPKQSKEEIAAKIAARNAEKQKEKELLAEQRKQELAESEIRKAEFKVRAAAEKQQREVERKAQEEKDRLIREEQEKKAQVLAKKQQAEQDRLEQQELERSARNRHRALSSSSGGRQKFVRANPTPEENQAAAIERYANKHFRNFQPDDVTLADHMEIAEATRLIKSSVEELSSIVQFCDASKKSTKEFHMIMSNVLLSLLARIFEFNTQMQASALFPLNSTRTLRNNLFHTSTLFINWPNQGKGYQDIESPNQCTANYAKMYFDNLKHFAKTLVKAFRNIPNKSQFRFNDIEETLFYEAMKELDQKKDQMRVNQNTFSRCVALIEFYNEQGKDLPIKFITHAQAFTIARACALLKDANKIPDDLMAEIAKGFRHGREYAAKINQFMSEQRQSFQPKPKPFVIEEATSPEAPASKTPKKAQPISPAESITPASQATNPAQITSAASPPAATKAQKKAQPSAAQSIKPASQATSPAQITSAASPPAATDAQKKPQFSSAAGSTKPASQATSPAQITSAASPPAATDAQKKPQFSSAADSTKPASQAVSPTQAAAQMTSSPLISEPTKAKNMRSVDDYADIQINNLIYYCDQNEKHFTNSKKILLTNALLGLVAVYSLTLSNDDTLSPQVRAKFNILYKNLFQLGSDLNINVKTIIENYQLAYDLVLEISKFSDENINDNMNVSNPFFKHKLFLPTKTNTLDSTKHGILKPCLAMINYYERNFPLDDISKSAYVWSIAQAEYLLLNFPERERGLPDILRKYSKSIFNTFLSRNEVDNEIIKKFILECDDYVLEQTYRPNTSTLGLPPKGLAPKALLPLNTSSHQSSASAIPASVTPASEESIESALVQNQAPTIEAAQSSEPAADEEKEPEGKHRQSAALDLSDESELISASSLKPNQSSIRPYRPVPNRENAKEFIVNLKTRVNELKYAIWEFEHGRDLSQESANVFIYSLIALSARIFELVSFHRFDVFSKYAYTRFLQKIYSHYDLLIEHNNNIELPRNSTPEFIKSNLHSLLQYSIKVIDYFERVPKLAIMPEENKLLLSEEDNKIIFLPDDMTTLSTFENKIISQSFFKKFLRNQDNDEIIRSQAQLENQALNYLNFLLSQRDSVDLNILLPAFAFAIARTVAILKPFKVELSIAFKNIAEAFHHQIDYLDVTYEFLKTVNKPFIINDIRAAAPTPQNEAIIAQPALPQPPAQAQLSQTYVDKEINFILQYCTTHENSHTKYVKNIILHALQGMISAKCEQFINSPSSINIDPDIKSKFKNLQKNLLYLTPNLILDDSALDNNLRILQNLAKQLTSSSFMAADSSSNNIFNTDLFRNPDDRNEESKQQLVVMPLIKGFQLYKKATFLPKNITEFAYAWDITRASDALMSAKDPYDVRFAEQMLKHAQPIKIHFLSGEPIQMMEITDFVTLTQNYIQAHPVSTVNPVNNPVNNPVSNPVKPSKPIPNVKKENQKSAEIKPPQESISLAIPGSDSFAVKTSRIVKDLDKRDLTFEAYVANTNNNPDGNPAADKYVFVLAYIYLYMAPESEWDKATDPYSEKRFSIRTNLIIINPYTEALDDQFIASFDSLK